MSKPLLPAFSSITKPVIGMIHLQPLPGAPHYNTDQDTIRTNMLADGQALVEGGVHAILLENFGDIPFYRNRVPHHVVACMTALACDLRRQYSVPLGINVLRNDGQAALAIAHAVGADFIRVNVLCGARITDQGIIQGIACDLLRERRQMKADTIKILADVAVKHSCSLADRPLEEEVHDLTQRAGADAVIVSGSATGRSVDLKQLGAIKTAACETPVLVGSGVTAKSIASLKPYSDGFIIGTAFKNNGITTNPIDPNRVTELMDRLG